MLVAMFLLKFRTTCELFGTQNIKFVPFSPHFFLPQIMQLIRHCLHPLLHECGVIRTLRIWDLHVSDGHILNSYNK